MTADADASRQDYSPAQRARILAVARRGVEAGVRRQRCTPDVGPDEAYLRAPRGCFVTLRRRSDGELRGCIGTFDQATPLIDNLLTMGAAATRDPRFAANPVRPDEMDRLRIAVSILTPRVRVGNPLTMRPGVDGIYILAPDNPASGGGCFLPDVASEMGWDAATTLSMCCRHKMGLPADAWRPPTDLAFYTFGAIAIAEP